MGTGPRDEIFTADAMFFVRLGGPGIRFTLTSQISRVTYRQLS